MANLNRKCSGYLRSFHKIQKKKEGWGERDAVIHHTLTPFVIMFSGLGRKLQGPAVSQTESANRENDSGGPS